MLGVLMLMVWCHEQAYHLIKHRVPDELIEQEIFDCSDLEYF